MKTISLLSILVLSLNAFAHAEPEVLKCSMTEPYITYSYDPSMNILSRTDNVIYPAVVVVSSDAKFVSLDSALDGQIGSRYQVVDSKTGEVYIQLVLNNNGTDGQSDQTYPYSAKINNMEAGCQSPSAPAVDLQNSVYRLKGSE